jgi:hypothetical protein
VAGPRFSFPAAVVSLAALTTALGGVVYETPARAHTAGSSAEVPPDVERVLGPGRVTARPDGLYEVQVDGGPPLLTHGPDPLNALLRPDVFDPPVILGASTPQRPPVCATDHYQHVFYARPSGAPDRYAEAAPAIRTIVQQMNATLNADSLASGGPTADYKVLCDASGAIRVDSVVTSTSTFSGIVGALTSLVFPPPEPNADRTTFFDGTQSNTCGLGSFLPDERPGPENGNNQGGATAVIYQPCWTAETAMHENGHNQGAVQNGAPNSTGAGGHCYDEEDVMCYSPDGGTRNQSGTVERCVDRVAFDCSHNDYFSAAPTAGSYLATHWNIGSRVNSFLVFGEGAQPVLKLKRGKWITAWAGPAGTWRYFKAKLPRRARKLRIALRACPAAGCQPNLDLFMKPRKKPSLSRFKKASQGPASVEAVRLGRPKKGVWYAGVYTSSGAGLSQFSIRATWKKRKRMTRATAPS